MFLSLLPQLTTWKRRVLSCDVCFSKLPDADVTSPTAEWVPLTAGWGDSRLCINNISRHQWQGDLSAPIWRLERSFPSSRAVGTFPLLSINVIPWTLTLVQINHSTWWDFPVLRSRCGCHYHENHKRKTAGLATERNSIHPSIVCTRSSL